MNQARVTGQEQTGAGSSVRTVAVIGIGSMGEPMARRIVAAGYELTVCDANPERMERFGASRVRASRHPSGCACDATIVLVANPEQLRTVVLGPDGLQSGTGGAPRYLVVMSTVSPQDMLDLRRSLPDTSTRLVDAPVSGGVMNAQAGTLTIMAGGAEADVAALRPLFETMGGRIFHCGPLGTGQATKIVNNVVAISNLMISAEAYRIALHNGLALDRLLPVLEASSGRNFISKGPATASDMYDAWSRSEQAFEALQSINRKDIDLALTCAGPEMTLPTLSALRRLLDEPAEEVMANWQDIGAAARPRERPA